MTNQCPIRLEADEAAHRAVVTFLPGGSCQANQRAVLDLLTGRPALASYDLVYDLRADREGFGNEEVDAVAEVYRRLPRLAGVKYSCFVTSDPHFPLWAEAMDSKFDDRRHRAFATLEGAHAFLDSAPR